MKKEEQTMKIDYKKLIPVLIGLFIGIMLTILMFLPTEVKESDISLKVLDPITNNVNENIILRNPNYDREDLRAKFKDGDDREIMDFELKSHSNVNEIKKVGLGNQVVMYYDVNSNYILSNALEEPEFTDMKTGEIVEREWKYVYFGETIREELTYNCYDRRNENGTMSNYCEQDGTREVIIEDWIDYNSRDIPNGKIRVGIQVEVREGDYIDGIWIIGGKRIEKHAVWTQSLNTDLVAYYNLNDLSGNPIDLTGNYTTVAQNITSYGSSGKIETALNFTGTSITNGSQFYNDSTFGITDYPFSFNVWMNSNETQQGESGIVGFVYPNGNYNIYGFGLNSTGYLRFIALRQTGGSDGEFYNTAIMPLTGSWVMVTAVFTNSTYRELYVNGTSVSNRTVSAGFSNTSHFIVGALDNGAVLPDGIQYPYSGKLDEIGVWSRSLSVAEVQQLYNSGDGIAYENMNTTLIYPSDNTNFTSDNINFSANISEIYSLGIKNVSLYINGTINNTNSSGIEGIYNWSVNIPDGTWNWSVLVYNNENASYLSSEKSFKIDWIINITNSFEESLLEGLQNIISSNFITRTVPNSAILVYNGTSYNGTINNRGNGNITITKTLTSQQVGSDTNVSFYWNVSATGETTKTFDTHNQILLNINIDDCSANSNVLYNFTIVNEETQTKLNATGDDTQGKIDMQLYGAGAVLLNQFNKTYNQTNSFAICFNSTGGTFTIDTQVQYGASGYETELYNIQNETINSTDFPTNITLYDLNTTNSQVFKLIVKDSSFLAINNALVEVYRKYIDEGVYKIVEIPKTDGNGETTAHLVVNNVIYKFIIKKYGITIATFDNVIAVCQTPLVSTCSIDFNAFATGITVPDYETIGDFNFTLDYNNLTRTISSKFTILSGTSATVLLEVTREDALGTSVCTDTLTSNSGTLSCVIPSNFGNSTVIAKLYKDSSLISQGQIKIDQQPADIYGSVLVVLALFVMLTLIGAGMSDNPVFTVIFFMVGVIILFALNLVANNGFIGSTATILFLIVAIIIVIIKGAKRN